MLPPLAHPEQAAAASIRGYLYQTIGIALRWLALPEGELLLCEGDEDAEQFILDEKGAVRDVTQVQFKDITGSLSARNEAIQSTLFNFLRAYHRHRAAGRTVRFAFTTSARRARQQIADGDHHAVALEVDVLRAWTTLRAQTDQTLAETQIIAAVRSLVAGAKVAPSADGRASKAERDYAELAAALEYVDGDTARRTEFLNAVTWEFDQGKAPDRMAELESAVAIDSRTRALPSASIASRLVVKVLQSSSEASLQLRTLDRAALDAVVRISSDELDAWVAAVRPDRLDLWMAELENRVGRLEDQTVAHAARLDDHDERLRDISSAGRRGSAATVERYLRALRAFVSTARAPLADADAQLVNVFVQLQVLDGKQPMDEAARTEIEQELGARNSASFFSRHLVPAGEVSHIASRVLVTGRTGAGKSTLVKVEVLRALEAYANDDTSPLPVLVGRAASPGVPITAAVLADLAIQTLAGHGADLHGTRNALVAAIDDGRATIFVDPLEGWSDTAVESLGGWVAHASARIVATSRPSLGRAERWDAWRIPRFTEVELQGISELDAITLLERHFGEDATQWGPELVAALRRLPDGQRWLENPMLLGLAGGVRSRDGWEPTSLLELYRRALDMLLERVPERVRIGMKEALVSFARRLAPPAGFPDISFDPTELHPWTAHALSSGLFVGHKRIEFVHLTLGEFLAAQTELDLSKERASLLVEATGWRGGLEILPMAHALAGPTAIEDAFQLARAHDTADHRVLKLVLRSLAYGGPSADQFCSRHPDELLHELAGRLEPASGRYGQSERELLNAAAGAWPQLAGVAGVARLADQLFGPLLTSHGEVAAEAEIIVHHLGTPPRERHPSFYWETIRRQAAALVQQERSVDGVIRRTPGKDAWRRHTALEILSKHGECVPWIRKLLDDPSARIREVAIRTLRGDADSVARIRAAVDDDDAQVRAEAVNALAETRDTELAFVFQRFLGEDHHVDVRLAAIDGLVKDTPSRPILRRLLARSSASKDPSARRIRSKLVRALRDDDLCARLIRRFIIDPAKDWYDRDTVRLVSTDERFIEAARTRLRAYDVLPIEVTGLASDAPSLEARRALLHHADASVVAAATESLSGDVGSRTDRLGLLEHASELVRIAAVKSFREDREVAAPALRKLIGGESDGSSIEAMKALSDEDDARALAWSYLNGNVESPHDHAGMAAGVEVLVRHEREFAGLRRFLIETADVGGVRGFGLRFARAKIVGALGPSDDSVVRLGLADPHDQVRVAAISVAKANGDAEQIRPLLDDEDHDVTRAAHEALSNDRSVRERLREWLDPDAGYVRIWAFAHLASEAKARDDLMRVACARGEARYAAIHVVARDPSARERVYGLTTDRDPRASAAVLDSLRLDPELRRRLRLQLAEPAWIRSWYPMSEHYQRYFTGDAEAANTLVNKLRDGDGALLCAITPIVATHPRARSFLVDIACSADDAMRERFGGEWMNVRMSAQRATADEPTVRAVLLADLASNNRTKRQVAAEALAPFPWARAAILGRLADDDEKVRTVALRVARESAEGRLALVERLRDEPEPTLRAAAAESCADIADAREHLLRCSTDDKDGEVRRAARRALNRDTPFVRGVALSALPLIQNHLATPSASSFAPPNGVLTGSGFEEALAILYARLCSARVGPDLTLLGEFEAGPTTLSSAARARVVVRIAMDAAELPRERQFFAAHNTIEAWRLARELRAPHPAVLLVACADLPFECIRPPRLKPGAVLLGPTFFGFRMHER